MSTTLATSQQPAIHVDNVTAHPGSTLAGIGVIAMAVGQMVATMPQPTSAIGWTALGLQLLAGFGAMLGK